MSQDAEEARAAYIRFRGQFLDYLGGFESWEAFRLSNESDRIKYDRNFFTEDFFRYIYFSKLTARFLQRHPYLAEYANHSDHVEYLYSKRRAIKVRAELFNISANEISYPNIRRSISCHSARHSLAMFLQEKDRPAYENQQLALYMRPLLTYPGDREYTLYYTAGVYDFPTVILTRAETLTWFLFYGPPEIRIRWCTKEFKLKPATIFYTHFFYPWQHKLTVVEMQRYCAEHNIYCPGSLPKNSVTRRIERVIEQRRSRTPIPPPNPTRYQRDLTLYPTYRYNRYQKEWTKIEAKSNEVPEYEYSREEKAWLPTGNMVRANNVIQLTGINKYHSPKRKRMNPNMHLSTLAKPKQGLYIYEYYPIYDMTAARMQVIVSNADKPIHPIPFEVEYGIEYERERRFGCILCPFRQVAYYRNLLEHNPWAYYYCRAVKLVASTRYLLTRGTEFWYFEEKEAEEGIM